MTPAVFDDEVAVKNDRLHLREQRIFAIDMTPTRLNHSNLRIAEIIHNVFEKIRWGNEVRIENRNQFACREIQTVFQSTRFETFTVGPVDVMDIEPDFAIFAHRGSGNFGSAIGRVVQNLNLQKFTRVAYPTSCLDQTFHNVHFVIDRQLYRHSRFFLQLCVRVRGPVLVFQIKKHQMVPVNTINGEHGQDREIWD